jgi:hypothetical protein
VVVSPEGAAIRVERIELSEAARQRLTTPLQSLGAPRAHSYSWATKR